jgi:hypothetical protein
MTATSNDSTCPQTTSDWQSYFAAAVAERSNLDEQTIEELDNQLLGDSLTLAFNDDLSNEDQHRIMIEKVDCLLAKYQRSESAAHTLIKKARQVSKSGGGAFPVTDIGNLPKLDDPLVRMHALSDELCRHGDYDKVRDDYCRLSILMNIEGRIAPAFRPKLVTGKKHGSPVFLSIHRDQLVIDCHWLQVTKQSVKVRAKDVEFASMFKADQSFPFELAWNFANKNWGANHRALDMLRLTDFQQCQLTSLRSDEFKAKVIGLTEGCRRDGKYWPSPLALFERGLSAWCERDKRIIKHRDGYVAVWKARSFLGASASVRQVAHLTALMLGEAPKDDKTIRSREENIRRHILGD